ncbi:MAG: MFS transporter [Oscillospiraceae bacterium]|nr:MFS transporter [Oscillospiraceae bacterium]
MKKIGYKHTVAASFTAFVVQAVVNNFAPLLFLTFQAQYGIELSKITVLITANFFIQIFVDLTAVLFVDRIGYRASTVLAHAMCATGLIFMTILPEILPSAFAGLLISVFCYAVGAGLLDITINPIVNSCPSTNSNQLLCLLHSFYCWGSVAVVGLSTLYFSIFTTANWKYLALIWAVVPIVNALNFIRVPIAPLIEEGETGLSFKQLIGNRMFWIFMLLILCSGASEQAVSQWASTFAEKGLGVSKTVGDLAGPMLFSVLMGVSRVIYGKFGDKIDLDGMMIFSGALCMASYLLIALSSSAVLGLVGVAMCGFSVGIMWPGTFSKASAGIKGGGTAMFALLALGGDLGCSSGPTFAGMMASAFGDDLKKGILCAIFFPALLTVLTIFTKRRKAKF